jgi:hypothetical protein
VLSCEQEHRVGLKPIIRRVFAPRGRQPVVKVNHRFEWVYVVAFVHPESGRSIWYLLPVLNTKAFQAVLDDFAATALEPSQPGRSKRILLVVDRAGWHTSKNLRVPDGIELIFQPAYSPERSKPVRCWCWAKKVQPSERLWVLSDEVLTNRYFGSLGVLMARLSEQCVRLMADLGRVRAATLFWWWSRITVI